MVSNSKFRNSKSFQYKSPFMYTQCIWIGWFEVKSLSQQLRKIAWFTDEIHWSINLVYRYSLFSYIYIDYCPYGSSEQISLFCYPIKKMLQQVSTQVTPIPFSMPKQKFLNPHKPPQKTIKPTKQLNVPKLNLKRIQHSMCFFL